MTMTGVSLRHCAPVGAHAFLGVRGGIGQPSLSHGGEHPCCGTLDCQNSARLVMLPVGLRVS